VRLTSLHPAARGVQRWAVVAVLPLLAGCLIVAAGAGVGGGVYYTKRGAESVVQGRFEHVLGAARQALQQHGVRIRRTEGRHDRDESKREAMLEGDQRERNLVVEVRLRQKGHGSVQVQVVARRSEVIWDKEFARAVLDRIVALAR
jgi:hypothetical protein